MGSLCGAKKPSTKTGERISGVGTSVVPPACGVEPTRVYGKVLPSNAKEPEKCETLETVWRCQAITASVEILLAASKRACAPWLCRNPTSASVGVSAGSGWFDWPKPIADNAKPRASTPAQRRRSRYSPNGIEPTNCISKLPADIFVYTEAFVDLFRTICGKCLQIG